MKRSQRWKNWNKFDKQDVRWSTLRLRMNLYCYPRSQGRARLAESWILIQDSIAQRLRRKNILFTCRILQGSRTETLPALAPKPIRPAQSQDMHIPVETHPVNKTQSVRLILNVIQINTVISVTISLNCRSVKNKAKLWLHYIKRCRHFGYN